ncbi:MAG TPA: hypothetical protein PLS73_08250 [Saprospiraceae bacterium]|nr:hypothetical protein [Saprospiraceae bacterium]
MVNSPDFKLGTSKFRHSATRSVLTYSIIIVGTLLLLATIIDILPIGLLAGYEELQSQVSKALFYSCLGLICMILGLERALDISRIETTLDYQNQTLEKTTIQIEESFINQDKILNSIDKHISEFKQYKLLENYHDIYNNSLLLIEKASSNIRSVVYANSPKAPDSWNETVAGLLKSKADAGFPVQFDLIICMTHEDMNEHFISATEKRFEIYKSRGADMYFHRYIQFMEKTIGQDCLIVDDKNLIISFPTIFSNRTQKALLFENQQETVVQFINWFNSYAMFEALSFKNALKMYSLKNKVNLSK